MEKVKVASTDDQDKHSEVKSVDSDNEWDVEPDIELVEVVDEDEADDEKENDTRNVNDIRSGRIYRKQTNPLPVVTPTKRKLIEGAIEMSVKKQSKITPKNSDENNNRRFDSLNVDKDINDEGNVEIPFSAVKDKEKVIEEVIDDNSVKDDDFAQGNIEHQ